MTYSLATSLNHPILTADEELELARRFKYQNDLKAAEKLVLSHLRYVASIVRDFLGYGLPQEDLFQEGTIGLMVAVRKFDPERGVRLATYARDWILERIKLFIQRNVRLVRIATTKEQLKLFWNQSVVNDNTEADTSKLLNVSEKVVKEFKARRGKDVFIDQEVEEDGESHPADWLASDAAGPEEIVVEGMFQSEMEERLLNALSKLDARRRRIVEARKMAEPPVELKDLAEEFGVSKQRIQQLEVEGIAKLRQLMLAD